MSDSNLEQEYERILENYRARGDLQPEAQQDKRKNPRLKVETSDLWIATVPEFSILDISISGLAIQSNHPLKEGEMIHISLDTILSTDAEVVRCVMIQSPSEYDDALFRIQCRFLEEYLGMKLLVSTIKLNG